MPVVTNNFSGQDTNWNISGTLALPVISESQTANYAYIPSLSKIFSHAIYTTLLDAGIDASYNENTCGINIWGFEFFIPITMSGYYKFPSIYLKGNQTLINTSSSGYYIANSSSYSFSITVRGSSDAINILIGGKDYETSENSIFFLAKTVHLPTNKNGFLCMSSLCNGSSNNLYSRTYFEDEPYTIHNTAYNYLKCYNVNNIELGTGKGYILVPQLTSDNTWYIKGMIESNIALLSPNKYYKLNNEIYYSNDNRFLYRVDI